MLERQCQLSHSVKNLGVFQVPNVVGRLLHDQFLTTECSLLVKVLIQVHVAQFTPCFLVIVIGIQIFDKCFNRFLVQVSFFQKDDLSLRCKLCILWINTWMIGYPFENNLPYGLDPFLRSCHILLELHSVCLVLPIASPLTAGVASSYHQIVLQVGQDNAIK